MVPMTDPSTDKTDIDSMYGMYVTPSRYIGPKGGLIT